MALQQKIPNVEVWIEFVSGGKVRYIHANAIASVLGYTRARALSFFHAFTGCDTVSSFAFHGKKSAWETWNSFPDVTEAFAALSCEPNSVLNHLPHVERFVILMYDRNSNSKFVNEARQQLFGRKGGRFDSLPPTQDALIQHVKRAAFQSGYCWYKSLETQQNLPNFADWGWIKTSETNKWQPLWTTLPPAGQVAPQLVCCKCVKGCVKNCTCLKAHRPCTALYRCNSACANSA
jgi:hypothetical protein